MARIYAPPITPTTEEALTFPVDPASSVTIPDGTVFTTQRQIDNFLTAAGGTAFQYWSQVLLALPPTIAHVVTGQAAAGVHRPHAANGVSWDYSRLTCVGVGQVRLVGTASSTWPEDSGLVDLTITGHSSVAGAPYVEFSGTPFAALDLRGRWVRDSTGFLSVIVEHTDSRLYVLHTAGMAPTNGVTTASVCRPGTIFRNSTNDSTTANATGFNITSHVRDSTKFIYLENLQIQAWGSTFQFCVYVERSNFQLNTCMIDALIGSPTANAKALYCQFAERQSALGLCSFTGNSVQADDAIHAVDHSLSVATTYIRGWTDAVRLDRGNHFLFNTVIDGAGSAVRGSITAVGAVLNLSAFSFGRVNEIRNGPTGKAGLYLLSCRLESFQIDAVQANAMIFRSINGPCVHLAGDNYLDMRVTGSVFVDGGDNDDVGIQMDGAKNYLGIKQATDVTGSVGDVRFSGQVLSYATITSDGGVVLDQRGNMMELVA